MTPVIVISSLTAEQKNAITAIVNAFGDMNLQFVDLNAFNANVGLPSTPVTPTAEPTTVPEPEVTKVDEPEEPVAEEKTDGQTEDDVSKSAPLAANSDVQPVEGKMTIMSPGDAATFKFNVIEMPEWDAAPTLFADFTDDGDKNVIRQGEWQFKFHNGFNSGIVAGKKDLGTIKGIECASLDKIPTSLSHAVSEDDNGKTPLLVVALAQSDE